MLFDPFILISLVIVITIHEFSHAWVANALGDPTAKLAGRISLNPLAHLDPIGVLMLFFVHIGWGKPVPVNDRYFSNAKRDTTLTALAGPFSNLLLALILMIPLKYLDNFLPGLVKNLLQSLFDVSVVLFAFNILPFPPLDGSKIIGIFIPDRYQFFYQRFLKNSMIYFLIFMIFDQFVLQQTIGFSFLRIFLETVYVFVKTVLFLGT